MYWSRSVFKDINPDLNKNAVLFFVTRKKEIEIIYKPTPVVDNAGNLQAILGNMLDNGSTPVIIKIDGEEVGSCFTIQIILDIPKNFHPKIPLQIDSVKDTDWAKANKDITLVILPTLAPLPFGADIKSIALDDDFIKEMKTLSFENRFWAKMIVDAHNQYTTDFNTGTVVKSLITSNQTSTTLDPCQAAIKGLKNVSHAISSPSIDASCLGKSYKREQGKIKDFFFCNPTPARVEVHEDEIQPEQQIPIQSATAQNVNQASAPNPPPEFYTQLPETMKTLQQAPPQQQKIVVKSREHEESVNLAKFHTNMLKSFNSTGKINWEGGTVKTVKLATYAHGFTNLLNRTALVQETQFASLLNTIFTTQPDDDDDDLANPLKRLMSLTVFSKKFTKAHLNTSFQCADLEADFMYKNPSINPFHYAPQNNCALVKAALTKIQEECNKFNWKINKKGKKTITSIIEGVGRINTMEAICMTCANMCGVMLAIVDVTNSKPLLYQSAWKFIKLIENIKIKTWMRNNNDGIAHLPYTFMAKLHQFFRSLASFFQNSINTNKVEINNLSLKMKQISAVVKLVTKFAKKNGQTHGQQLGPYRNPSLCKEFLCREKQWKYHNRTIC
jgi:hypothetical protein